MRPLPLALIAVLPLAAVPARAAAPPQPQVGIQVRFDVSPPLAEIPPVVPNPGPDREVPNLRYDRPSRPAAPGGDPLLLSSQASGPSTQSTPAPIHNLEGMSADDNFALLAMRFAPADPVGDVGPTHYVQAVNLLLSVHLKSTGARIYGPVALKTLWSGFGGLCESQNDGDPIVLYDDAADRWVISQLAIDSTWSGHQCIAVSTTGNPTGSYHRYDFAMTPAYLNDYPKIGVWPDGYYMSVNEFDDLGFFYGVSVVAFERARMLTGASAQMVKLHPYPYPCEMFPPAPECPFSLQPAHWEGGTPPPGGTPNPFLMAWDDEVNGTGANPDGYRLYDFAVDWTTPASSTFTARPQVVSPEFDRQIFTVPEPAPGEPLDALADYTMYRLQYRNFGGYEALVTNHTVDVNGADLAGIRWAELRRSGGGWTLHQTGTHAPADGLHRWNGSIAMDGFGHIALGYNVASSSKHASVRYVSRAAADPLGTLPGGEIELVSGAGVQQSSSNRWGDYAALSVDPVDDCTFWLTQEYLTDSGQYDWKTRIGAFDLCGPGCTPTETPEASCADGLDNDRDGLTDAADPDCGPPPPTTTFVSVAADDGYVLESGENTNVGGSTKSNDSGTSALRAGDNQQDRQYRSILSFDTAPIPDGATVQTVTLRARRGSLTGTNPFTTHGSLTADVRSGGFNGNAALESADFQAPATATAVCTLSNAPANGDWSECVLDAAGLAAVNKAGKTQVRIRFTTDDNDDTGNDYLGYYSGDNGTAANRPQLVVTYQ